MSTGNGAWMRITAYGDKWSVQQGDTIRIYVNCDGPSAYNAQLVKLIQGDTNPSGPGVKEIPTEAPFNGHHDGHQQVVYSGSHVVVADRRPLRVESFTLQCWIWPTMPIKPGGYWKQGAQGLITKWSDNRGYGLFLNEDGALELRINGERLTTGAPVRDHAWHFVAATFDAESGEALLYHEPQIRYALDPVIEPVSARPHAPSRPKQPAPPGPAPDRISFTVTIRIARDHASACTPGLSRARSQAIHDILSDLLPRRRDRHCDRVKKPPKTTFPANKRDEAYPPGKVKHKITVTLKALSPAGTP